MVVERIEVVPNSKWPTHFANVLLPVRLPWNVGDSARTRVWRLHQLLVKNWFKASTAGSV